MRDVQESTRGQSLVAGATQEFVRRLVTTIKPRLAVENRADAGVTLPLLEGLRNNGFGKLVVCDADAHRCAALRKEIADLDDSSSVAVEIGKQSVLECKLDDVIDLLVCSGDQKQVLESMLPQVNPFGVVLLHTGEGEHKAIREFALRMENEGTISVVLLPESLGLVMAQKRGGRK